MRSLHFPAVALTLGLVFTSSHATSSFDSVTPRQQHSGHEAGTMHVYPLAEIQWKDGPPSLPAGARFAVLEGDPAKEGLFTMRLRLPDGYQIPAHFHSGVEHVTVIAGTFHVGMGEKFDKAAAKRMPTATFGYWPAGMRHYAWAEGDTILQLHGIGPWTITYVNPADDPRARKK